jgi:putative membrane protein
MLHPASAAVNLLPQTWAFVRSAWPVLLILLFRSGDEVGGQQAFDLSLLAFFLLMTIGRTLVHFLTLRYRMVQGRLEIRSGLLNRQNRVLSPEKVQNVEMVRNVFHRMSGLVEVRIETASGTEVEGMLSALSVEEAERLVSALQPRARPAAEVDEVEIPALVENDWTDLVKFGASSSRVGASIVVMGVVYEGMLTIDPTLPLRSAGDVGWTGAFALFFAVLAGAWLVGIGNAVEAHWGYRLVLDDDALVAQEGLLTRRRVQLRVRKVQRVTLRATWLRRLLGFGSVTIETAAAGAGSGGVQQASAMVPVVGEDEVDTLVRHAMPEADVPLASEALRRPADKALQRALIRGAIQGGIFGGVLTWVFWPMGLLGLLLVPLNLALGWLDWRYQRWLVTDRVVLSRVGFLSRTTTIVARDKLQSVDLDQGPLLRRYGLASVIVRVAGSGVRMPLLTFDEAYALVAELGATAGRTAPVAPPPVLAAQPAPMPTAPAPFSADAPDTVVATLAPPVMFSAEAADTVVAPLPTAFSDDEAETVIASGEILQAARASALRETAFVEEVPTDPSLDG